MGVTATDPALDNPLTQLDGQAEGAVSADGQILASYCHGLFDHPAALAALAEWAGHRPQTLFDANERRERDLDRLADAVEQHLRLDLLAAWFNPV